MVMFIRQWGIYGVILSAAVAYIIEMILLGYFVRNDYVMRFNILKLIVVPATLVLSIVLGEIIFSTINTTLLHGAYGILCFMLLWFSYRREIRLLDPRHLK
jgi:hypothetical protein